MKQPTADEAAARALMSRVLEVDVEMHDDGTHPAMHDFVFRLPNGRVGAAEMTTITDSADREWSRLNESRVSCRRDGLGRSDDARPRCDSQNSCVISKFSPRSQSTTTRPASSDSPVGLSCRRTRRSSGIGRLVSTSTASVVTEMQGRSCSPATASAASSQMSRRSILSWSGSSNYSLTIASTATSRRSTRRAALSSIWCSGSTWATQSHPSARSSYSRNPRLSQVVHLRFPVDPSPGSG